MPVFCSAWIGEEMDPTGMVETVNRRIEAITGLSMTTAEQLQVVNYGIGGHYEPHFDYAHVSIHFNYAHVNILITLM